MGRGDIYKDAKPFSKGDPRINRNGRPKKLYTDHILDIKAKGYNAPTKTEYFDMIGLLLAMDEDDLKEFAQDKTRPYWIRLIVIDMNAKASRQKMMSDYRDWLFGKAQQEIDHRSMGEKINNSIDIAALAESINNLANKE